jgi:hypothetical protein
MNEPKEQTDYVLVAETGLLGTQLTQPEPQPPQPPKEDDHG